jgi:hypothetical protein
MIRINGLRIVTSDLLTETIPYSRSPARARRRAAMGHRQYYATRPQDKAVQMPDGTIVMHPELLRVIKRLIAEREAAKAVNHSVYVHAI